VFEGCDENGDEVIVKFHRLGRTSFRCVKTKRDYLGKRQASSWLYMSRLSALREFSFMQLLASKGFPVPRPIDANRHCIVMSRAEGMLLGHVSSLEDPQAVYERLMDLIVSLAESGFVHGDFNEFNLIISEDEQQIVMFDFPQMISTSHSSAFEYFCRDVNCIRIFFARKFKLQFDDDIAPEELWQEMEKPSDGIVPVDDDLLLEQAFEDLEIDSSLDPENRETHLENPHLEKAEPNQDLVEHPDLKQDESDLEERDDAQSPRPVQDLDQVFRGLPKRSTIRRNLKKKELDKKIVKKTGKAKRQEIKQSFHAMSRE